MTLINLTTQFIHNNKPSIAQRLYLAFDLDEYHASSLSAIEEFSENPPFKRDLSYRANSAYVFLDNIQIKEVDEKTFSKKLRRGINPPCFWVKDKSKICSATWGAGDGLEYSSQKENFGFNTIDFVLIPKIMIQYVHNNSKYIFLNDQESLVIRNLYPYDIPPKKALKEKILELAPKQELPLIQPSF